MAARKVRHGTEFGEAFEQTPARAILQVGRADGRRGRDGINGETGRARSRSAAGRRLPPAPSPCWRAGGVWDASRMGFRRLSKKSAGVAAERLTGKHAERMAQWTAPKAGVGDDRFEATTAKPSPAIRRAPAKTRRRKEAARRKGGTQSALASLASLAFLAARNAQGYLALPSRCGRSHRQQSSRTRRLNDEGRKISGGSRMLKGATDFTAVRASSRPPRKQGWNSINGLTQDPSGLAKSLRLPRQLPKKEHFSILRGTLSCWAEPSHAGGDLPCSKSAGVSQKKSASGGATKMQHTAKLQLRCAINAALWLRRAC